MWGSNEESDVARSIKSWVHSAADRGAESSVGAHARSEQEISGVRKPDLAQAGAEETCFTEATTLVELLRTKKVSFVEVGGV